MQQTGPIKQAGNPQFGASFNVNRRKKGHWKFSDLLGLKALGLIRSYGEYQTHNRC